MSFLHFSVVDAHGKHKGMQRRVQSTKSMFFCQHSNLCLSPLRQTSPRFKRACLVLLFQTGFSLEILSAGTQMTAIRGKGVVEIQPQIHIVCTALFLSHVLFESVYLHQPCSCHPWSMVVRALQSASRDASWMCSILWSWRKPLKLSSKISRRLSRTWQPHWRLRSPARTVAGMTTDHEVSATTWCELGQRQPEAIQCGQRQSACDHTICPVSSSPSQTTTPIRTSAHPRSARDCWACHQVGPS